MGSQNAISGLTNPSLLAYLNGQLGQGQQAQQAAQKAGAGITGPQQMQMSGAPALPQMGPGGQGQPVPGSTPGITAAPQGGGMGLNGGFMNPNTGNQAPGSANPMGGGVSNSVGNGPNGGLPASMAQPAGNPANASTLAQTGANQLQNILSGNNLSPNSNPWLAGMANAANQSLISQYQNATAPSLIAQAAANGGGAGSLGNNSSFQGAQGLNEQMLAQGLSNQDTNLFGQNYANAQNQISQGLNQIGGVQQGLYSPGNELLGIGTLQQQQEQQDLNTQYQNNLNANNYPMNQLSQFGSILGQAIGGSGNQLSVGTQNK